MTIHMHLFSVKAYVYIPMMLFVAKNCYKYSKMGIQGMIDIFCLRFLVFRF